MTQTWTCGKCDMRFEVRPFREYSQRSRCPECGQKFWHGEVKREAGPVKISSIGVEWADLPEIAKEYIKP